MSFRELDPETAAERDWLEAGVEAAEARRRQQARAEQEADDGP